MTAKLREGLPPRLAPLAGPLTAGVGELADRTAKRVIASGAFGKVWDETNRRAHTQLLAVINDDSGVLTSRGIILDLRLELGVLAERIGVTLGQTGDKGRVRILRGDTLDTVQKAVKLLRDVRWGSLALLVILLVAGVAVARNRARALGGAGAALIIAGLLVLVIRRIAGTYVVNEVSAHGAGRPAAEATWRIATSLLADIAVTGIVLGLVLAAGAWLAGGTGWARSVRRFTAPVLIDHPELAYAVVVALLALLLLGGLLPTVGGGVGRAGLSPAGGRGRLGLAPDRRAGAHHPRRVTAHHPLRADHRWRQVNDEPERHREQPDCHRLPRHVHRPPGRCQPRRGARAI